MKYSMEGMLERLWQSVLMVINHMGHTFRQSFQTAKRKLCNFPY